MLLKQQSPSYLHIDMFIIVHYAYGIQLMYDHGHNKLEG